MRRRQVARSCERACRPQCKHRPHAARSRVGSLVHEPDLRRGQRLRAAAAVAVDPKGCEAIARGRRLVGGRLEGWITRRSRANIGTAQFRFCTQAAGAATDRGGGMRAGLSRHGRLVFRPAHRSRGDTVAPCHVKPRLDARQPHQDGLPARPEYAGGAARRRRPRQAAAAGRAHWNLDHFVGCARSPARACASTIRPPANGRSRGPRSTKHSPASRSSCGRQRNSPRATSAGASVCSTSPDGSTARSAIS